MNALSPGTEDITHDSSQTIGSITSQVVGVPSPAFTNLTATYILVSTYTSDINYLINNQSISVIENSSSQKEVDLTCSLSGNTPISFSISNYMTSIVPSWVSIDSNSGTLSITSPEVASDTEFYFYINSVISGVPGSVQKLIKLTILNCIPTNCLKCLSTSSST